LLQRLGHCHFENGLHISVETGQRFVSIVFLLKASASNEDLVAMAAVLCLCLIVGPDRQSAIL
jgi:hypothetical protein